MNNLLNYYFEDEDKYDHVSKMLVNVCFDPFWNYGKNNWKSRFSL